jgi:hypothetical protein
MPIPHLDSKAFRDFYHEEKCRKVPEEEVQLIEKINEM